MPVKFLNRILRINQEQLSTEKGVLEGVYLMECDGLKKEELLFNDGKPSIILMPNREDRVSITVNTQKKEFQSAWVTFGELNHSYMDIPQSLDYLIIIRFNGHAFFDLFGITPQGIKNKPICNFHDFQNDEIVQHIFKSYDILDPQERVRYLREYLSQLQVLNTFPKLLEDMVEVISTDDKVFTVSDLSTIFKATLNDKWIQRSFNKYFGISPKKYLKMHRFIRVHGTLDRCQSDSKLALALAHGYYDGNHFIKDFKNITGYTPHSYLLK